MVLHLPDEIILQIIRNCISSWTLSIIPCVTIAVNSQKDQSDGDVVEQNTTLGCCFSGYPDSKNLKLVNRLFYDEIVRMHWLQFDGRVQARMDADNERFKVYSRLSRMPRFVWDNVVELHLKHNHGFEYTRHLVRFSMPRLQLVSLEEGLFYPDVPGTFDQALSGALDEAVKVLIKKFQSRFCMNWNFWLSRMGDGGMIKAAIVLKLIIPCVRFNFEIGCSTGLFITHRTEEIEDYSAHVYD